MRNKDNDCIRYLMKEMDPSEELLMERAMMEDEDLLIEVESMRQTLQKLDKLPEKEPPSHITESVLEKAAEQAEKNRKDNQPTRQPAFKVAVAATLALTITASGAWFFGGSENGPNQPQQQEVATSVSSASSAPEQVPEGTAGFQFSTITDDFLSPASFMETNNIDPWVDRNDILRFEDHFYNQNEQFKAILDRSTQKLQLIENPMPEGQQHNTVQLTGSGN